MKNKLPIEAIKTLLIACHEAKRVVELQPPLPEGLTPGNLKVLDYMPITLSNITAGWLYKSPISAKQISTPPLQPSPSFTKPCLRISLRCRATLPLSSKG